MAPIDGAENARGKSTQRQPLMATQLPASGDRMTEDIEVETVVEDLGKSDKAGLGPSKNTVKKLIEIPLQYENEANETERNPGTTEAEGDRGEDGYSSEYVKPRIVLMIFMTAIMIFIGCAIGDQGEAGIALLSLVLFFESCIFHTIFTVSIRGLGRPTKRGSSWIVASVCGGALFPSLTGLAADHSTYHIAMAVPLAGFFVSWSFPIYLNTYCRQELDGFRTTKIGYVDERRGTVIGDISDEANLPSGRVGENSAVEYVAAV
jgi:hypothetical protein